MPNFANQLDGSWDAALRGGGGGGTYILIHPVVFASFNVMSAALLYSIVVFHG